MGGDQSKIEKLTLFGYAIQSDMVERYNEALDTINKETDLE